MGSSIGQRKDAFGEVAAQALRYGIAGVILAGFYAALYLLSVLAGVPPFAANSFAWLAALALGFVLHSRWSFRGRDRRERPLRSGLSFLAVNVTGFLVNTLWIWLAVEALGLHAAAPLVPILLVTPLLSFWLNRRYSFA